jgi:hypothetical protein
MLTPEAFRKLVLALPDAVEDSHMGHPDFRIGGRIFASIYQDLERGMVKLAPAEQRAFVQKHPDQFAPASGAWGRAGCTEVRFAEASPATVRAALTAAWENVVHAPPTRVARSAKKAVKDRKRR